MSSQRRSGVRSPFSRTTRAQQNQLFAGKKLTRARDSEQAVSPGPTYSVPTAIGAQRESARPSSPAFTVGRAQRPPMHRADGDTPGPGAYGAAISGGMGGAAY